MVRSEVTHQRSSLSLISSTRAWESGDFFGQCRTESANIAELCEESGCKIVRTVSFRAATELEGKKLNIAECFSTFGEKPLARERTGWQCRERMTHDDGCLVDSEDPAMRIPPQYEWATTVSSPATLCRARLDDAPVLDP